MSISYLKKKNIIDKIRKLNTSLHYDIYTILKKYELNSTKNNNGIFFNLEDVNDTIIDELNDYLEQSQHVNEHEKNDELINLNESVVCASNDKLDTLNVKPKITMQHECQNIVDSLSPKHDVNAIHILNTLEKEKHELINKRTAINVFSAVKKKYSKPIISEYKYSNNEILEMDLT
jgi:hypothetical protein